MLSSDVFSIILQSKSNHDDSKMITKLLIDNPVLITNQTQSMNETERTIIALLYHEKTNDNRTKYDAYSKSMGGCPTWIILVNHERR